MSEEEGNAMTQTVTAEPAILCQDLIRIFREQGVEVQALQGLNLRIGVGELVGIVGESGSGKSTLMSILSGLDAPSAGSAVVSGHDLVGLKRAQRTRYQREVVGFVWQQTARNLLPYLTSAQNVAVVLTGIDRVRRRARVAELLDLLTVSDCANRRPTEMSGGQQQRVAIAVALANGPRVLLADEPTGELDEETAAVVLEAIRTVNSQLGVTTVIVTHDPAVSEHVRRTVQIRDGRTSTEVLRRTTSDRFGVQITTAQEYAVLDRVGRLQLPSNFMSRLDLADRVRLALEPDHIGVWHADSTPAPDPGEGQR
ncbi:ABC-type lipoprotein export system ATPase subunit [Nakamurella sp. UYEF19]|uniref:ABC transporter ATP-binding protein n=1 Tax=Nakamurella sp. UYEF19 TaxID=1756392 RepID=UPI003392C7BE